MIGRILDAPDFVSNFARVQDMYKNDFTVPASEVPKGTEEGDTFAYSVNIWHNPSGDAATLRPLSTSG